MSDSHGNSNAVVKIVEKNIYIADMFIHLGDGENDTWRALQEYPDIKLYQVRGNCDHADKFPESQVIESVVGLDNKLFKIFMTHGHLQNVSKTIDDLLQTAKENNYNVVLFGHTHRRYSETIDNILFVNPGSCARPYDDECASYAYIDISMWGTIMGFESVE